MVQNVEHNKNHDNKRTRNTAVTVPADFVHGDKNPLREERDATRLRRRRVDATKPFEHFTEESPVVPGGIIVTGGVECLLDDRDRFRQVLRNRRRRFRRRLPAAHGGMGGAGIPFVIGQLRPGLSAHCGGRGRVEVSHTNIVRNLYESVFGKRKARARFPTVSGSFYLLTL